MAVIETEGLVKRFGGVSALRGLDLQVEEGEVFGFLGPNGAGKSTAINVLLGFLRPTAGSASVFGLDACSESVAIRRRTGALLEGSGVYENASGLTHVRDAVRTKRADDDPEALLEEVGLADAARRRAGGYSTGMKQRLGLAMALAGSPELLVLDEPSAGLDPNGVRRLRETVRSVRDRGATVFFSSHVMGQVEAVCDRVGILYDGRLVTAGSVAELRSELDADAVLKVTVEEAPNGLASSLAALDGVVGVDASRHRLHVTCSGGATKYEVLSRIHETGSMVDFTTAEPSLDEVFARYTGAVA